MSSAADEVVLCSYCQGRIRWAVTPGGRRVPLDAAPHTAGTVLLIKGQAAVLGPRQADGARAEGKQLYRLHAVSCPDADKWRVPERRPHPRRATRRP